MSAFLRSWRLRRQLRARYLAVKAQNDRVFWYAYECAAGVSAVTRGRKGQMRFAVDALKTTAGYDEETTLRRELQALGVKGLTIGG